ncbi:MAG: ATP-dependent sacrificial sulfur transferase LarE [Peptostreptococcaceae bacterium]|nr:ATP-dependent sacrificial sulfur transferase LarE [Peptostreptococcaceae bacterium]
MTLEEFFSKNRKVALCFSGGVDSSYLLYAALHYGAHVQPYYLKTEFQPEFELEDARNLAKELGVKLIIKTASSLDNPQIVQNDEQRCYHCKNTGLRQIYEMAKADGYNVVIDGSNADDDPNERPGMKALEEMGILSPLRMANLTKAQIRALSKEANLFTWDKAAYACLATRIPSGMKLEKEMLQKVERSERVLFDMGFYDFRVRVLGDYARLEIREEQMQKAIDNRQRIIDQIAFDKVLLDLEPR